MRRCRLEQSAWPALTELDWTERYQVTGAASSEAARSISTAICVQGEDGVSSFTAIKAAPDAGARSASRRGVGSVSDDTIV